MKAWTLTITAAALAATLTLAGCAEDGPAVVGVPDPVPGDPAVYAPDGWPLQIGDKVTSDDRDWLRKEFLSPHQWAIHVVGDQLYAAKWEWPEEPHDYSRFVYAGHFPATLPWRAAANEHLLPEQFHGKIEYDPVPPYTIMLYGRPMRVDEKGYLAWRKYKQRVDEHNEKRRR